MFTAGWYDNLENILPNDVLADSGRRFRLKPEFNIGIDIKADRPFSSCRSDQIVDAISLGLNREYPALELTTLLSDVAGYRKAKIQNKVKSLFQKAYCSPIPWLMPARKTIRTKSNDFKSKSATSSNYFVLLIRNGEYECYVGQTATSNLSNWASRQEARIAQHFCGIRASIHVKNYGYEPLWSLNCFTENVLYENRKSAETKYNNALSNVGITVRGDIQP